MILRGCLGALRGWDCRTYSSVLRPAPVRGRRRRWRGRGWRLLTASPGIAGWVGLAASSLLFFTSCWRLGGCWLRCRLRLRSSVAFHLRRGWSCRRTGCARTALPVLMQCTPKSHNRHATGCKFPSGHQEIQEYSFFLRHCQLHAHMTDDHEVYWFSNLIQHGNGWMSTRNSTADKGPISSNTGQQQCRYTCSKLDQEW
jgi:hypothetical protein